MLNDLLNSLKLPDAGVENIIYLGAGTCPEFHTLKALQPARIVLVEANRQNVAELKSAYGSEENLVVLENLVVAEEETAVELRVANLPGYSSILEPSRLSDYYPSIRILRKEKVPTITLEAICDKFATDAEAGTRELASATRTANVLIVDLNGYEAKFIASLSPAVIHRFDLVLCRASVEALYAGAQPVTELESIIRSLHFVPELLRELAYPFVMLSAVPNELALVRSELHSTMSRKRQFKSELERLQAELRSTQLVRQALALECEQLQEGNSKLQFELDKSRERNDQSERQIEELRAELCEAEALQEQATKYAQLQTENTALRAEMDEAKCRNGELERQLERIGAENEAAQDARLKQAGEQEQLQAEFEAVRTDKEELSRSNQLFGKTLLKTQTDLDDMRRQYRELKQAKARQNGVMMQVAQRLDQASEQYIKLVEKYPELRELGETVLLPMVAAAEGEAE